MASNDGLSDWTYKVSVVFIAIVPYCHTDVEFVKKLSRQQVQLEVWCSCDSVCKVELLL